MATPRTILLVDDEPHVTYVMQHKLEAEGYAVVTAQNGAQGLAAARECKPDLIVTDYQMPVCDGLQFAHELAICDATAETPVILVTARGYQVKPSEIVATNIQCVMDKPFSPRKLIATIEGLIDGDGTSGRVAEAA